MKKRIIAMLAGLTVFAGAAFAVTPADIFLNYGGRINEGDSIVDVAVALPWDMITTNGGRLPTFVGEYEYALPIGPVPFTFGGYAGATGSWGDGWGIFTLKAGGSAKYHIAVPPVPGLDFYIGLKLGIGINMGSLPSGYTVVGFEPGMDVGVSYFFNDSVGITGAVGYPSARIGMIFKL